MLRRVKASIVVSALVALAVGCGGGSEPGKGELTDVNVGYVPFSDNAVLFLAIENGTFKKHGLNVKVTPAASPTPIVASMVSGQAQFGFITTPVLINANLENTKVKCVSVVDGQVAEDRDSSALVASPQSGIKDLEGLSGKKVAVVQMSSINLIGAKKLADDAGATGIKYVTVPFPQMPQALKSGRVDAAVITSPFLNTALKNGAKELAHPSSDLFPGGTIYCYGATDQYLQKNPEQAKAFRDAINETTRYAKTHEDEAKETLVKYLKLSPEEAQKLVIPTNYVPEINVDSIGEIQDLMKEQGAIERTLDPSDLVWEPTG